MKRKIFSLIVVLVVTISFINVWISVGSTNAKVKLRLTCYDSWTGAADGSITCWGAEYCKRGIKKEGIVIITETRWVECDGKRTEC